jgi:lipid II:glycine glycyltransferase (peptidoglycan interpeptide bridge formation enzyme)
VKVHQDPGSWNAAIGGLPGAHILQTWEWGQVKARFGWKPTTLLWEDEEGCAQAAALLLERELGFSGAGGLLRMLYTPRGPLLDWGNAPLRRKVLGDLANLAAQRGGFFLKIDPEVAAGTGVPDSPGAPDDPLGEEILAELHTGGWRLSNEQVQYRNTYVVDLRPSEEELQKAMKQKTRYNIRLAGRKGVEVREAGPAELDLLYHMYAETGKRDGFTLREEAYYKTVWGTFLASGLARPLIAYVGPEPVAGLLLFLFAGRAWYLYGMSLPVHREKMPNYLLQWQAMRLAKAAGCTSYDMWGAPDEFHSEDPMWGVFRFKQGFPGEVVRHIGAWDLPLKSAVYRLYTVVLPRVLRVLRLRGRSSADRSAGSV